MSLTVEDKERLLIEFFNTMIENEKDQKIGFIEQQKLINNVVLQIPAHEFNGLVKDIYPSLNQLHEFDKNPLGRSKALRVASTIKSVVVDYNAIEEQNTLAKAKRSTFLFCLFIITIPFAIFFYNKKVAEYHKEQTFQKIFVDKSYLDAEDKAPHTVYDDMSSKSRNSYKNVYGLLNTTIRNTLKESPKPFAEVLFNKKGQVTEQLISAEHGFSGRYGINLMGTHDQILDLISKFKNSNEKMKEEQNDQELDRGGFSHI